jgi:hypothetical protein
MKLNRAAMRRFSLEIGMLFLRCGSLRRIKIFAPLDEIMPWTGIKMGGGKGMPFTFAHPAAAIPFLRYRNRFRMDAMILGTMAPDFEYFLRGRPYGIYGHTLPGIVLFDLPLVVAVYLVGRYLVLPTIGSYLPHAFQPKQPQSRSGIYAAFVFVYSSLIGVLSHIAWDSFTHADGAVVKHVAMLDETIRIHGLGIPVYKIL